MEDGTKVIFVIAPDSPDCDEEASHVGVASVRSDAMSGVTSPGIYILQWNTVIVITDIVMKLTLVPIRI
jgi:hypothetical protein